MTDRSQPGGPFRWVATFKCMYARQRMQGGREKTLMPTSGCASGTRLNGKCPLFHGRSFDGRGRCFFRLSQRSGSLRSQSQTRRLVCDDRSHLQNLTHTTTAGRKAGQLLVGTNRNARTRTTKESSFCVRCPVRLEAARVARGSRNQNIARSSVRYWMASRRWCEAMASAASRSATVLATLRMRW